MQEKLCEETMTAHSSPDKCTVLLVDDDSTIRYLYSQTFSRYGYATQTASNGEEAIRKIETDPKAIGAVVIDYNMPIMEGLTAAAIIRKINPSIKIILCSALGDLKADDFNGLFDHVLRKPASIREITQAVADAVRSRHEPQL